MNLYEIFSSKKFLLKYSTNNQYIFFLLDIFNNIIQYQYNGNYHLIYAMVHKKEKFTQLLNLTTLPVQQQQRSKQQPTTIKEMANNGLLRESVDDVVVDGFSSFFSKFLSKRLFLVKPFFEKVL